MLPERQQQAGIVNGRKTALVSLAGVLYQMGSRYWSA